MRFYFNLPGRVTKVKIVLTEEKDGELVQEKSYNFTKEQFKAFLNDHQRAAYINALVGADWTNPEDVRKTKKEMRAKRKARKEKRSIVNGESARGLNKEEFEQAIAEGAVVVGADLNHSDPIQEKGDEGGGN